MMRGEVSPEINAISTVVLAVSLLLLVAALRIGRTAETHKEATT
jgi:ABC-type spermidine/putrescine transport system permease subunit II